MQQVSYMAAVRWIAVDGADVGGPDYLDVQELADYATVRLVSDLFGRPVDQVARDVVARRLRNQLRTLRSAREELARAPSRSEAERAHADLGRALDTAAELLRLGRLGGLGGDEGAGR